MENRLSNLESLFAEMHTVVKGQGIVNTNLEKTLGLLQQSHIEFVRRHEMDVEPKVKELWENRSQLKGGYILASVACSIVVGAATVIGVILAIKR
jgi:hypothetical protein